MARNRTTALEPGDTLAPLERALIELGVAVSVTSLDRDAIERAIVVALDAGASAAQIQEIVSLVSGLGVHSLMASASAIIAAAANRGEDFSQPFDERQQQLWDSFVGDDHYWAAFEKAVPGFLDALVRLSPDQFEAFFIYCAVPWKNGAVRARTKELTALACDATPAHRFLPGFSLHLDNAIAIGVGRQAIMETLDIAEAAPRHEGLRKNDSFLTSQLHLSLHSGYEGKHAGGL